MNDLKLFYRGHLYNESGDNIPGWDWGPKRISEDYYLLGNGGIALIYHPYELYSFADGATTIRFNREEVEYFNRKNRR